MQRRAAPTRRIQNWASALEVVRRGLPPGANLVVFSDKPATPPLTTTLELFSRADLVVGVHGAGLANAVVMPEGGRLIEITLPEPHARYYRHLARCNDLTYTAVQLQGSALYSAVNITVPLAPLDAAVRAALGTAT